MKGTIKKEILLLDTQGLYSVMKIYLFLMGSNGNKEESCLVVFLITISSSVKLIKFKKYAKKLLIKCNRITQTPKTKIK